MKFSSELSQKWTVVVTLVISLFIGISLFQNCSSANFGSTPGSDTPKKSSIELGAIDTPNEGNGVGYDGKIYVIKGDCHGNPNSAVDSILVAEDKSRAHRLRKDCTELNPPSSIVPSHITQLNDYEISYAGETFTLESKVAETIEFSFTQAGTHSWIKPGIGTRIEIECWGGGGGGAGGGATGSLGGAGGGGGYSLRTLPLSQIATTETVKVGAGGTGAPQSYVYGVAGGDSSFGSHLVAAGGKGGKPTCDTGPVSGNLNGLGGTGVTAAGADAFNGNGGKGGGAGGGAGGSVGVSGTAPGGGGGGQWGLGGGGACGNGAGQAGHGAVGRCNIRVLP